MKDMKTEDLEKMLKELKEELDKREQERQNMLAAEKEARYKEVIDAYGNFEELRSKYVDDYGSFTFKTIKESDSDSHSWFWNTIGLF